MSPSCSCKCMCPHGKQYSGQSTSVRSNQHSYGPMLARKPTIENGYTSDFYDDGDFELVE
jgi:hypothetical protein